MSPTETQQIAESWEHLRGHLEPWMDDSLKILLRALGDEEATEGECVQLTLFDMPSSSASTPCRRA